MSEYKRLTERVGNEVHELAWSGEILPARRSQWSMWRN